MILMLLLAGDQQDKGEGYPGMSPCHKGLRRRRPLTKSDPL